MIHRLSATGYLLCSVCFLRSVVYAQGFLPPVSVSTSTTPTSSNPGDDAPLLIGQKVPESLAVVDDQGQERKLLSYKSFLEVMVVVFESPRCDAAKSEWPKLRRLDEKFKDWHVAFLTINTSTPAMLPELAASMQHQKLSWPVVQDAQRKAATVLQISGTPEVVILDEGGVLRYRGPVDGAPTALDAVIGHVDKVAQPELPMNTGCSL